MDHDTPNFFVVLATHGDGEPPKTLDAHYVKDITYYFDNPKKTPFNFIMGVTLDQREYFRDYHLTHKGKLLWDQIHMLHWYAWNLCQRYDYSCCSRMLHIFPFHVNLMIMKPWLLMLEVYMISMMWNE